MVTNKQNKNCKISKIKSTNDLYKSVVEELSHNSLTSLYWTPELVDYLAV